MPVPMPFTLDEGETLLLVHNTPSGYKNYITFLNSSLKAFRYIGEEKKYYSLAQALDAVKSVQYIGNTIILYTGDAPHYFLFDADSEEYKYLGSKIPDINISFNLTGYVEKGDSFFVQVDDFPPKNTIENMNGLPDEYVTSITSQVLAEVNKFINEHSVTPGKFMYPFFVRYAYLMHDGTYTMHSAPVLMLPSTLISPLCVHQSWNDVDLDNHGWKYSSYVAAYVAQLMYAVQDDLSQLDSWADIVKGIDIFVSPPIYTYDQNGQVKQAVKYGSARPFKTEYQGYNTSSASTAYKRRNMFSSLVGAANVSSYYVWELPGKDLTDIYDSISSCASFHKYISFTIEELKGNPTRVIDNEEMNVNPISAIETKATLTDDYMTHDTLVPESTFVYNKRLNISNITRHLFGGFSPASIAQPGWQGATAALALDTEDTDDTEEPEGGGGGGDVSYDTIDLAAYDIYTFIHSQEGKDIVVKSDTAYSIHFFGTYLFYPDTDAYKMIVVDRTNGRYAEVTLSEHSLLNGAFAFSSFEALSFQSGTPSIGVTGNTERLPNKLFTSEVNNPFHFPLEGINTVGADTILGMAAVTVPISQGQFGQFPLMVFCTDGNFALKVDDEGYYSGISPIQEDTVLGSEKITPLENSIVVITKKGIMMTSGGEMAQISVNMDGRHFDASELPSADAGIDRYASLIEWASDTGSFLAFLYGARMAYDYSSNRLIVYNPSKRYAYVYSFENGTAVKMSIGGARIVTSVMDYPDTLLQDENGNVYSTYAKQDINELADRRPGIAVTRPIKLDNAMARKMIYDIRNMGSFTEKSVVKYRLYGSNDGFSYSLVKSLRSSSFVYYRMVIYSDMLPKESFSGTALAFEFRLSHKFR